MENNNKDSIIEIKQNLAQFTGSENWYRHSIYRNFLYTDGVQYIAEQCGAYGMIDQIFMYELTIDKLKEEEFKVWELILDKEGEGAKLVCTDGNENNLYSEEIIFTDFPLKSIKFYCQNNVLLLSSEY